MSGDLGNLLTGELGEAEARFAHEDFVADYGRRVVGRVRRRRAVRAAGVGGGTMLTAGALTLGATHMPWGVLGATPGAGLTDCVTPSPSDGAHVVTVTIGGSDERPSAQVVMTDPATGGVLLAGVEQSDGTWVFTYEDGNPAEATLGTDGSYSVHMSDASGEITWSMPSLTPSPSDPSLADVPQGEISTYTVWAPEAAAVPRASDDCYTPSPTPSAVPSLSIDNVYKTDPSLAAKPEDVTSPFQCGFVMDNLTHESSQVSITGYEWVNPVDFNATLQAWWPGSDTLPVELGSASIPTVRVQLDGDQTALFGSGFGPGEPTDETAFTENGTRIVVGGASFVKVRDGVVVATMDTALEATQGAGSHFFLDYDGTTHDMTLVNASDAFMACPGQTIEPADATTFAVAGSYVKGASGVPSTGVDYSWAAIEPE